LNPNGEALDASIQMPPGSSASRVTCLGSRLPAQWRGDSMDYGLAVQVLMQREARAARGQGGAI
jgi:hypothetical protein